ncbi:cystathionine gamma-lyase-like isoform X2 [Stegodyphus dumicola]|uniref:cystathionine gamma-lyase-like isoform X2 n=1 Tax=Stegodyphus dumicola TaxID=202533 RepID=UPI0015A794FC|nr:cystathionine gamma-lyase-like isoform X2 [Stegodyphus dumicola]
MLRFETRAVHGGQVQRKLENKPNLLPITLDTFEDEASVAENSNKQALEEHIASLECAKYALCFPSGLGAVTSIIQLLNEGDHAIIFDSVYHGTRTYLKICEDTGRVKVTFADLRDLKNLEKNLKENTKLVWIETPCNPTMKILDIKGIADYLKPRKDVLLVVDNTFMSAYFQNPVVLGADIAMHSLTKYMNGYSDVIMGAMATNSETIYKKLKENQKCLASHPQLELSKKQSKGFGGMVSFCIKGGTSEAMSFVQALKVFTLAVSLGSAESLVEIPSLMTASPLSKELRKELDITDNLIRMSVGLESAKDLIEDLEQALDAV